MNGENASGAGVLFIGTDACLDKFKAFLAEMGFPGRISHDAATSRDFALGVLPKVIIVGTKVPPFDGAAMVEMLRSEKRLDPVPILLLSERSGSKADAAAGADETLPLSVEPLTLYDAVLRWTTHSATRGAAAAPRPAAPKPAGSRAPAASAPKTPPLAEGELRPGAILKLIYQLSEERGDYVLAVKIQSAKLKVRIQAGKIVNVASNHVPVVSLRALLVSEGRITSAEGEAAYEKARDAGMRQGEMLVKLGYLDAAEMAEAIRRQKKLKLRYLIGRAAPRGEYSVHAADPSSKNVLPLDLPAPPFLFETVVNELPAHVATDGLAEMTDVQNRVEFTDRVADVLRRLECPPLFLLAPRLLQGKSIAEIRGQSPAADEEKWVKFLFLMAALDCVRFVVPATAAEALPPPPPPPPSSPPRPTVSAPPPPVHAAETTAAPRTPGPKFVMPPAAEEKLRRARELIHERRYSEAIAALGAAAQLAPNSAEIAALAAWAEFSSLTHYDDLIVGVIRRRLEKAIEVDPDCEWPHLYLGKILKDQKDEAGCLAHFLAALAINPHNEETQREVTLAQIKERTWRGYGVHD